MRRCGNDRAVALLRATTEAMRLVRLKLSPDRTRNEEIQDRQNAFVWSDEHIFRPHQHFTHDPCSWSRSLEQSMKKQRKLSMVERLRSLEQRQLEEKQSASATAGGSSKCANHMDGEKAEGPRFYGAVGDSEDLKEYVANEDYFYTMQQEEKPNDPPLQELVDEVQSLHVLLSSPRYEDTPLATVERLQCAYSEALRCVFDRVRNASVGKTMSCNALLFSWSLLLQGLPALLESLAEKRTEECLVRALSTVHEALNIVLQEFNRITHSKERVELLPLEGWIESLDVVTHPLTNKDYTSLKGNIRLPESSFKPQCKLDSATVEFVHSRAIQAAAIRMIENDQSDVETEPLDPYHLYILLRCMVRLAEKGVNDSHIHRAALLTGMVGERIFSSLERTVAPPRRYSLRHALLGKQLRDASKPHAIPLDVCAPPGGVKKPPTAADDVLLLTRACTLLMNVATNVLPQTKFKVLETVDTVLKTLSYAPNYDLSTADTVIFSNMVLEELHHVDEASATDRHLRVLLLLSRLRLSMCADRSALSHLLSCLCNLLPPHSIQQDKLREWKRLRGLVMRHLLYSVRGEEVEQHYTRVLKSSETWVEHLAFGQYSGGLPLSLWLEACHIYLTAGRKLTVSCAEALITLRGRCKDGGVLRSSNSAGVCPLDFVSVTLLAQLLEVVSHGCCSADDLVASPVAWDKVRQTIQGAIGEDENTIQLLRAGRLCVADRQATGSLVTTYP
ncbi:hypothetical protein, conserved [Trypanosoma brucei brucei TREU927]|uniref:Uncharacterized protein n=2 Tax=Trypanosoma brucei TaxID=5691 RepID=Q57U79_TRYB2|nr:hypothetical protein, conserved [Trypanosoma brucei brucei TREU927]AAX70840.1 hypothetical protein, conserved [Trypanosoma brucei]AAZ11498.1 hypothetical protein, conserved [Trypanosoma brucei brucei TREU927]